MMVYINIGAINPRCFFFDRPLWYMLPDVTWGFARRVCTNVRTDEAFAKEPGCGPSGAHMRIHILLYAPSLHNNISMVGNRGMYVVMRTIVVIG